MNCRFCNNVVTQVFADLGMSPLANSYLKSEDLNEMEPFYPLRTFICNECLLVQLEEFESPEHIFSNYAYFSSYSETWLNHVEDLASKTTNRFGLDKNSRVIEVASNDGYLLQYFKKKNIDILGIEPASNIAKIAEEKGIPTIIKFFNTNTAKELKNSGKQADILIAINVLPHVPNLNDFIDGIKIVLKNNGVVIIQFSAYMLQLIQQNEFDTIYHEHFSYFSLLSLQKIFEAHNLIIFDVEELPIHGGSLRIYAKHKENNTLSVSQSIINLIEKETAFGLRNLKTYDSFQKQISTVKLNVWNFFINAKNSGKRIVGYGAPAKGNTLLNFCGIGTDLIEYTVDINPHKQGLHLPGSHIPIMSPEKIRQTRPDYVLILAWNLKDEIMKQMSYIREWGGKFVIFIPEVKIYQ